MTKKELPEDSLKINDDTIQKKKPVALCFHTVPAQKILL